MKPFILLIFFVSLASSQDNFNYATDTLAVRAILNANGMTMTYIDGITDSADGRITHLALPSHPPLLLTHIPEAVGNLTALKSLKAIMCELTDLPDTLGSLPVLEELELESNNFTTIPACIGRLTTLRSIKLCHNSITDVPDFIGNLTNLENIGLRNNQIDAIPDTIGNLVNLFSLYLSQNNLQTLPSNIGNLPKLTILKVAENKLIALPESTGNLTKLISFNIAYNLLTDLPQSIVNLNSCNLYYNRLCSLSMEIQGWADIVAPGWRATQECDIRIEAGSTKINKYPFISINPNPFNASTQIIFALEAPVLVKADVFNVSGMKIARLVNTYHIPGRYKFNWSAKNIRPGYYLLKVSFGNNTIIKKVTVLR